MAGREWYACRNEEDWTFAEGPYESWQEAALAAPGDLDLEPGQTYHVGRRAAFAPHVNEDSVLDSIVSQAWDRVGKHAADWPDCTIDQARDLGRRLTGVLAAWLAEIGETPRFFPVEDITTHTAPASDA